MSKHTPGPWVVEHTATAGLRVVHGPVDEPTGFRDDVPQGRGILTVEAQANARLIAAAPDLLEALENLENDDGAIPDHAWQMVQAAIAKARG